MAALLTILGLLSFLSFLLVDGSILDELPALRGSAGCDACKNVFVKVDEIIAMNSTLATAEDIADVVCQLDQAGGNCEGPFDSWQCQQVCYYAVREYAPEVQFLLITQILNPDYVCYRAGFDCEVPAPVPEPTPIPDELSDTGSRNYSGIGYIFHMTDVHYDPWAKPFTVADCGMPVCCRESDDNHTYANTTYGGLYGSYLNCDASPNVISSMWDYIKNNITTTYGDDLDFAVWVGDGVPHDVNNQSKWTHLQIMKTLNNGLKETFQDIPVFPILGNHEGLPVDQFQGPEFDAWMTSAMGSQWAQWTDTRYSLNDTILPSQQMSYAGYYTSLIRPGLRLIALHTGYTEAGNFYLTFNVDPGRDMASQLMWFKDTLAQARALKEKVIVLKHHSVRSFEQVLQTSWYDTFTEYSDIIQIIFTGHAHVDEFHVFGSFPSNINSSHHSSSSSSSSYSSSLQTNSSNPYAVEFLAGSITTRSDRNPAFRVYSYDRATMQLLDYTQYRFDLGKSNELQQPVWFAAYSAKEEYGLQDLSAEEMMKLAQRIASDEQLFETFSNNYDNGRNSKQLNQNSTACQLLSATDEEYDYCKKHVYLNDVTKKQMEANW